MKRNLALAAAFGLTASMAHAQMTTDAVAADFAAQGFSRIEIRDGLSQMKVEAIRGSEKVEVVFDKATGTVLKRETETVGLFENDADGISIRNTHRDFLRVSTGGAADPGRGEDDGDDDSDDADDDSKDRDRHRGDRSGDDDRSDDGDDSDDRDGDDSDGDDDSGDD